MWRFNTRLTSSNNYRVENSLWRLIDPAQSFHTLFIETQNHLFSHRKWAFLSCRSSTLVNSTESPDEKQFGNNLEDFRVHQNRQKKEWQYFGRENYEVDEIRKRMKENISFTIQGSAGIGKKTLIRKIAEEHNKKLTVVTMASNAEDCLTNFKRVWEHCNSLRDLRRILEAKKNGEIVLFDDFHYCCRDFYGKFEDEICNVLRVIQFI